MSIINPTLTEPRYLNKADFPNQTGLFGFHMNQSTGVVNPPNISVDNNPTFLTDDTFNFIVSEQLSFGRNGRTMLVDDHVGNYNRCGAFVDSSDDRTSEFGLTTLGDNLLFSTGLSDFDDKFAISFWMRMRNGATGINDKGTVLNWNSGTTTNGTQTGNIFIWRQGTYFLRYASNGDLVFGFAAGTQVLSGVPDVADWIHFTMVRTFIGNDGNGLWNIYINGVKTEVNTSGITFGEFSNLAYNEAATALSPGSTFTFDLSEVWLTSEGSDGYNGTIWDDAQVLKMYQIGAGLFREPTHILTSKANSGATGTFTWVAPVGVTSLTLTAAAAGGTGGSGGSPVNGLRPSSGGGGGGGGAFLVREPVTIVPGETYTLFASSAGNNFTLAGNINGTASSTLTLNTGLNGGGGGTSGTNFGSVGGGAGGGGGTSSTTAGETSVAGATGGAGPGASTTSSPGGATGGSTSTASGGSGGGGSNGAGGNHASGGGGGGASFAGGGTGGGAAGGSAPGAGGGAGGGGFVIGNNGGGGSANSGGGGGSGGNGGFTFEYLLPVGGTDSPLVGP